jgi:hypothetical protein
MHPMLLANNFVPPYWLMRIPQDNVAIDNMILQRFGNKYIISTEESLWMTYSFDTEEEALELYSHYYWAQGHCVCTGLGLGVREGWLLRNPKVTKITVIEKNASVIELHRKYNPDFSKLNIIQANANEVKMSCDTLLPDHYSKEGMNFMLEDLDKLAANIDCKVMWFWPLEEFLLELAACRTYMKKYMEFKTQRYPKLPDCTTHELYNILSTWYTTYATREIEGR